MLHDFDDIGLKVIKNLDSKTLNISLANLAENDAMIFPQNSYIPKIWECRWYNDQTIAGYARGDIVWKWIMDEDVFLSNYASLIQQYASDNSRLCGYFKFPASDWMSERNRYQNVISGYAESDIKYFPMLFDYCYNFETSSYAPELTNIEIYISLSDDNKSLLSNTLYWKNVILKTDDDVRQYVSNDISTMFAQHVKDYHLDDTNTLSGFDELLLANNLSNFNINDAYFALDVKNHSQYINQQGVDYVVKFGKTYSKTKLMPSQTYLYQWYRQWSSGYLEHGGIVEIPSYPMSASLNPSCYVYNIDLNWEISLGISAPFYDYPTTSLPYYTNEFDLLYFAKTGDSIVQENIQKKNMGLLGHTQRYSISLTPITVVSSDIMPTTLAYGSFDVLSTLAYPLLANDDKNKTYLNFEVHEQKNYQFKITRSCTRDLRENSIARYVQYYTTGYIANPNRDYAISSCSFEDLLSSYVYSGESIYPSMPPVGYATMQIVNNIKESLVSGEHYYIEYGDDCISVGPHSLSVYAIAPYYGVLLSSFNIQNDE